MRNILAATDLSEASIPALCYARLFAERFGARVTIIYTDPVFFPIETVGPSAAMFVAPPTAEYEARVRSEVIEYVTPLIGNTPFDVEVPMGQPVATILQVCRERDCDLIVVGTHQRHGWQRALLGSVSGGVLYGSSKPVLAVAVDGRGSDSAAVTKVMCPVNFTIAAHDAAIEAARIAEKFGAELILAHVLERGETHGGTSREETIRSWIAPELQDICSYRDLVMRGDAAERLLDCADDLKADLLVIGAQHRVFRDATVVGTTTERLIRFASCPVLVVPRHPVKHDETTAQNPRDAILRW